MSWSQEEYYNTSLISKFLHRKLFDVDVGACREGWGGGTEESKIKQKEEKREEN